MQIVARLQRIRQLTWHSLVPQDRVEIQNRIKGARVANEVIDFLPRLLPQTARVRLERGVAAGSRKGRDGRCEQRDVERVDPRRDLLVRGDEAVVRDCLVGDGFVRSADVVDAFEDHGVFDAHVRKDVSVDAG